MLYDKVFAKSPNLYIKSCYYLYVVFICGVLEYGVVGRRLINSLIKVIDNGSYNFTR